MNARQHHTYVLRVWLEPADGSPGWRASLSDISGLEPSSRRYFSDVDALVRYLKDELEGCYEGGPEGFPPREEPQEPSHH